MGPEEDADDDDIPECVDVEQDQDDIDIKPMKPIDDDPEPIESRAQAPHDDIKLDDAAQFQEQRSRWKREVFAAVRLKPFWLLLDISHKCIKPLDHFLNVMQEKGTDSPSGKQLFRYLVCGKVKELSGEFG